MIFKRIQFLVAFCLKNLKKDLSVIIIHSHWQEKLKQVSKVSWIINKTFKKSILVLDSYKINIQLKPLDTSNFIMEFYKTCFYTLQGHSF